MRQKILDSVFWIAVVFAWTTFGLLGCAVLAIYGAPLLLVLALTLVVVFGVLETKRGLSGRSALKTLPSPGASSETSVATKALALPSSHERLKS